MRDGDVRSAPHRRRHLIRAQFGPMLRIALLDDNPAVLAGLRRLISSEPHDVGHALVVLGLARRLGPPGVDLVGRLVDEQAPGL